jgi:ZIP family zinc transporter
MSFEQTVLLSAIAGATIFLGLPVGRLRNLSTRSQALMTAGAAGVILFLIWDILAQAAEPVEASIETFSEGQSPAGDLAVTLAAFGFSIAFGLLSLVWFAARVRRRREDGLSTHDVALGTAIGLGLHNLSEGLAIGQSAAAGETSLALLLIIGFGLHNATEGFGIVAPLAAEDQRPGWGFLVTMGVVGGGPTFVGTVLGRSFVNDTVFLLFLALAAGSILYVVMMLIRVAGRQGHPELVMWCIFGGLAAGFATDYVLVAAGG